VTVLLPEPMKAKIDDHCRLIAKVADLRSPLSLSSETFALSDFCRLLPVLRAPWRIRGDAISATRRSVRRMIINIGKRESTKRVIKRGLRGMNYFLGKRTAESPAGKRPARRGSASLFRAAVT